MLDRDQISSIFSKLRKYSSSDQVELLVGGGKSSLTRFANNYIHQNVAEENYNISVRVQFGGKTARATTNKHDDESLRRTVKAAEDLARVQEDDPDLLPLASSSDRDSATAESPNRYFDQTAAIGPRERADVVGKMVDVARKHGHVSAGVFAINQGVEAIINSRGIFHYHTQTTAEASVTMTAKDSSGWQKANSPDVSQIDPVRLAEIAAQKATDSAHPQEVPAGKYTVILEPAAVLDIVGFMFWDFGGLAILDQRSFLNDRVGTKLFGENINISDDVFHPLQSGPTFDGEGIARQKVTLVENGVVKNLVYSRASAERIQKSDFAFRLGEVRPTGHGFPLPNEIGEAPTNIVFHVNGPTKTVDQMISETERAVLVTRLWYIREVDPSDKILTGMTRDGTFLVENGKVRHGLLNFRFNQGLVEMLSNVEATSEPVRASGEESFDMVAPAMKVRDFNFTEVTKF
jgi:predicted Zn-dependent protease